MHRLAGNRARRRDPPDRGLPLQRHELQGQRQGKPASVPATGHGSSIVCVSVAGPLRGGRCVAVRHAEGGARADASGLRRGGQAELHQEPASGAVSAHRQQAGHETVRIQESTDEGTDTTKGCWSLGHTSMLQFSVSRFADFDHTKLGGCTYILICCQQQQNLQDILIQSFGFIFSIEF